MTSITARPAELTGRIVRPGDTDYPDDKRRLEPALHPRSGSDRVRPGDAGRGQRAGLGAAEQCHGSCA